MTPVIFELDSDYAFCSHRLYLGDILDGLGLIINSKIILSKSIELLIQKLHELFIGMAMPFYGIKYV